MTRSFTPAIKEFLRLNALYNVDCAEWLTNEGKAPTRERDFHSMKFTFENRRTVTLTADEMALTLTGTRPNWCNLPRTIYDGTNYQPN